MCKKNHRMNVVQGELKLKHTDEKSVNVND